MTWIKSNWGFSANIAPNNSAKTHLEYAISAAGHKHAERSTVYTHTGWKKIGGEWAFLHGKGAIGAERVQMELEPGFERYRYLFNYKRAYSQSSFDKHNKAPVQNIERVLRKRKIIYG
jgi:hypothetical protein